MSDAQESQGGSPEAQAGELSLDDLLSEAKFKPEEQTYEIAKEGVRELIKTMVSDEHKGQRVDKELVDAMIAEVDKQISAQVNEILHHKDFQKLESAWRGLKYLVDQVDFRQNTKVEVLSVSKERLLEDFKETPETVASGLFKLVYSEEYGKYGGEPYGVMVANYDFGAGPQDMDLLQRCASVAAMSHAPFLANADPAFFDEDGFEHAKLKDLESHFENRFPTWDSFRDSEDSRYVGLCMPRFLLRLPYGSKTVPAKTFNFEEDVVAKHNNYLWGYASLALGARVAHSFARYRWCPHIIGPKAGGTVEDLPMHEYEAMGERQRKIPIELSLSERQEYELAEQGFIGLVHHKHSDNACFFSANSCQRPKVFQDSPEGKLAETNFRLGTQMPYIFIVTRLAHYLKVLQRYEIGKSIDRAQLEKNLNTWIGQYVVQMDNPDPVTRARRPLRNARVAVEDVDGQPGWYRCRLEVQPHSKFMGVDFTLSLVGRLDKD